MSITKYNNLTIWIPYWQTQSQNMFLGIDRQYAAPQLKDYMDLKIWKTLPKERQCELISNHPWWIAEIDDQSEEIQLAAINADPHTITLLKNPSQELQTYAKLLTF